MRTRFRKRSASCGGSADVSLFPSPRRIAREPITAGRQTQSGFTLVELLVVIAIIALLISILLPTLSKARDQAKRVNCQSNLRQIAIASTMYANAFRGWLPHGQPLAGPFGYEYLLDARGPWGVLFDARTLPLDLPPNSNNRTEPGVADFMFCPGQITTQFLQPNSNNRACYQARYFYSPKASVPFAARRVSSLKPGQSIFADVFIYNSQVHKDKGINVGRADGSVKWFAWPTGGRPTWTLLGDRYVVEQYWNDVIDAD